MFVRGTCFETVSYSLKLLNFPKAVATFNFVPGPIFHIFRTLPSIGTTYEIA
jgi:hypothetical protein